MLCGTSVQGEYNHRVNRLQTICLVYLGLFFTDLKLLAEQASFCQPFDSNHFHLFSVDVVFSVLFMKLNFFVFVMTHSSLF